MGNAVRPNTPLRTPALRRLLLAKLFAATATSAQHVVAAWYVLDRTNSATAVGILAGVVFAPGLVASVMGGWLLQKYPLQKYVATLCFMRVFPLALVCLLIWTGDIPIPVFYALLFVAGAVGGLSSAASSMLPVYAAPPEMKPRMVTNGALFFNVARLAGPLAGSLLIVTLGVASAFLISALAWLVMGIVALRATVRTSESITPTAREKPSSSYQKRVRTGFGYDLARAAIFGSLLFFGLVAPIQQLMPSVAGTYGSHPLYLGILVSTIGLGGILTNPHFLRLRKRMHPSEIVDLSLMIAGPTLLLLGLSSSLWIDIALLLGVGAAWELMWLGSQTTLELEIPGEIRGEMIAVFYALVAGGTALGAVLLGILMDAVGVKDSLVMYGIAVCLYGVWSFVRFAKSHAPVARQDSELS